MNGANTIPSLLVCIFDRACWMEALHCSC